MLIEKRDDQYVVTGNRPYAVREQRFDTLDAAGNYCEERRFEIDNNAEGVGFKLGALIVAMDTGKLSAHTVVAALIESTDLAYSDTARKLARALLGAL